MSWTDRKAMNVIKYLRDKFKVKTFIETGTYKGVNLMYQSLNFKEVISCEIDGNYYRLATDRLHKLNRSFCIYNWPSKMFLEILMSVNYQFSTNIIYLDAHFYDPKLPKGKGKFVVLDELKALKGCTNQIVIIHDFDNGLGHITYDGISLDMDLLRPYLKKVNPNFHYYTNELASCDIMTLEEAKMTKDKDIIENIEYAWKEPRLTFRGILYCLPKPLTKTEMKTLGLRKWN